MLETFKALCKYPNLYLFEIFIWRKLENWNFRKLTLVPCYQLIISSAEKKKKGLFLRCALKAPLAGSREISWKKGIHQVFRARTCVSTAVLIVLFLCIQSHPFPDTIMICLYFIYFVITDFKIPYRWASHVNIPEGSKLKAWKSNKYRQDITLHAFNNNSKHNGICSCQDKVNLILWPIWSEFHVPKYFYTYFYLHLSNFCTLFMELHLALFTSYYY